MTRLAPMLIAASLSMVACGPGAKIAATKQGAAEALFAASRPSKASADQNASPALIGSISWDCPQGGSAKVVGTGVAIGFGTTTSVAQNFTLEFDGCGLATSDYGNALYNGQMTFTQAVTAAPSDVSVSQAIKGKVNVQGAFDDFIDADITQAINASALASTADVSMSLKGSITTGEGTFTFDEMVSLVAGHLSATLTKK